MDVWIAQYVMPYETVDVVGVFSTREKAMAHCEDRWLERRVFLGKQDNTPIKWDAIDPDDGSVSQDSNSDYYCAEKWTVDAE